MSVLEDPNVRLDNVVFKSLLDSDNTFLTSVFEEIEIKNAIWECGSGKSPAPHRLSFSSIKKHWKNLKKDVIAAIQSFHNEGSIPRGYNASFITLIPKSDNPQVLDKYRPIPLVGCIYKTLSKVLSIRVKKVIDKGIDVLQSTFLSQRGILDIVLVANEVVDELKRKKGSGMIIKLDYEKAYDSISWDFLFYMMDKLGFCRKWIEWIRVCIESSSISVLVNGSPTKRIQSI